MAATNVYAFAFEVRKLSINAIIDLLDNVFMAIESKYGGEHVDSLLCELCAQQAACAAAPANEAVADAGAGAGSDAFALNLLQLNEQQIRQTLAAAFVCMERHLGASAFDRVLCQLMYRVQLRIGKHEDEDDDDDDNGDEDGDEDKDFDTDTDDSDYLSDDWQHLVAQGSRAAAVANVSDASNDNADSINRANEERELMSSNC